VADDALLREFAAPKNIRERRECLAMRMRAARAGIKTWFAALWAITVQG